MKADSKQPNLSWRGDVAYFRKSIGNGRETWKSLGKLSLDDARRIVKHMVEKLNAEQLEEKLGLIAKRSSTAKLRQVFEAWEKYTAGVRIDPRTVRECAQALRRIVRTVYGDAFDVDAADTALLSEDLLADYDAVMVRDRKLEAKKHHWDAEKIDAQLQTVARTTRSTVQQARSLFSKDALASSAYRALDLPELERFMRKKIGQSTVVAYDPPAPEVLERIRANAGALKIEDAAAWLALMLEVNAGLRVSSAVEAKWEWFLERGVDQDKQPVVYLDVRLAKGGNSMVRFDANLYDEMKAMRADLREYIIPGAPAGELAAVADFERADVDRKARRLVFDRLKTWLRAQGLKDRRQPNHELRKWFGDQMYITHGAAAGQDALGHSSEKLFKTVYAQRRTKHSLRVI